MIEHNSALDLSKYGALRGTRANFLCTPQGEFELNRSSRPLSNQEDRRLLAHLRSLSEAVIVGGATARNEVYRVSTKFETYVFTNNPDSLIEGFHPLNFFDDEGLGDIFSVLRTKHDHLLVEAGPSLLSKFLSLGLIDQLCLTIAGPDESPAEVAAKVLGVVDIGAPQALQEVLGYRFCMWNLR